MPRSRPRVAAPHRTSSAILVRFALLFLPLAGCMAAASDDVPVAGSAGTDRVPVAAADSVAGAPADTGRATATEPTAEAALAALGDPPVVRALYVNRWAAQSRARMRALIELADRTRVDALVLDMKDEFGLNFRPDDPALAQYAGDAGAVRDLPALLDTLRAHGIMPVARVVVFKDSIAARVSPDETIRTSSGGTWRDEKGLAWVSPYSPAIREYNLRVAEALARMGFAEIQFDYIRFPEPYASLPTQVFPKQDGVRKPEALASFLAEARRRLHPLGARSTADVFGLTTSAGALEIGQHWETLAPVTDVLLPMVYPSHYPRGAFGVARPNAEPYTIVKTAITRARERSAALGIEGETVRPYLQAFSLGAPDYGAAEVAAQIRAVEESGYNGWVLWHPGSKYEAFVGALR